MVASRGYASPSRGASQLAVWRDVAAMAEGQSARDLLWDWGTPVCVHLLRSTIGLQCIINYIKKYECQHYP
jgi:hypothetical protein